jgi:hypothetical protein
MHKVTPIRGGNIVERLELLLEEARQGNVIAISYAVVLEGDETVEGYAGNIDECAVLLYGAINILRDVYFVHNIET